MSLDFTDRLLRLRGKYNIQQQNSDYDIIKLEDVSQNAIDNKKEKDEPQSVINNEVIESIQENEINNHEEYQNINEHRLIKIMKFKAELFRLILLTLSKIMDYVLYRVHNN